MQILHNRLAHLARRVPILGVVGARTGLAGMDDLRLAEVYGAHLDIPIITDTEEERLGRETRDMGRKYARQEEWETLGKLIRLNDKARAASPGGTGLADLLAYGARADVVQPVELALSDPGLMSAHAPRGGLDELEAILEDYPDEYGVALVVAQAHVDIGWAWRGQGWMSEVPEKHWQAFHHHFDRAGEILDEFDAFESDSPALAAARCALLAAAPAPKVRVADDYEDLIDLDPGNARHMRALGNHLLPRWFGSYEQLELEARRTAARTGDIWGAGAYTWVNFDALRVDPQVLAHLDTDFFLDGMTDILKRRPHQHLANQMAAFGAVTLQHPRYDAAGLAKPAQALRGALDWILRDHLAEVHPIVWGVAAQGMPGQAGTRARDGADIAETGRTCALARIGRHFERDLKRGRRVVFGEGGVRLEAP